MLPTKPRRPKRKVIYPRDIEIITGVSRRQAQHMIQKIKIAFGKQKHQFVTVREFSLVYGIPEDTILENI